MVGGSGTRQRRYWLREPATAGSVWQQRGRKCERSVHKDDSVSRLRILVAISSIAQGGYRCDCHLIEGARRQRG